MTKIQKIHLRKAQKFAGFAANNCKIGEVIIEVIWRRFITSNNPEFYKYIKQISKNFLGKSKVLESTVSNFIVLLHENESADLYINDFPIQLSIKIKDKIEKGELVSQDKIADIKKITFPEIEIKKTDGVIICLKVGWKFLLFFDLRTDKQEFNSENMQSDLANVYKQLSFEHIYKVFESQKEFKKLFKDGWFPFIEIMGKDFQELIRIYENNFDTKTRINNFLSKFNEKRIQKISERWWNKKVFKDKKKILKEGIKSYNEGKFICCIKILSSEIEGIVRIYFKKKTGNDPKCNWKDVLSTEIINREGASSLFFPENFLIYLKDYVFNKFSLEDASYKKNQRHTVNHGTADASSYTQEKSLQLILILDQIYFYLN